MADRQEASALREECDALSNENCRLRVTADHQSSTIGELVSQNARLLTERDALAAQVEALKVDAERWRALLSLESVTIMFPDNFLGVVKRLDTGSKMACKEFEDFIDPARKEPK